MSNHGQQKSSLGNDLLSQGPTPQVPSALEGLTSWFGMEQGVSPPLKSPKELLSHIQLLTLTEQNEMMQFPKEHICELSPRPLVRLS